MKRTIKLISLVLTIMMLMNISMLSFAENKSDIPETYKSKWLPAAGLNAQEMMASSKMRAIVTVGLVLEWYYKTLNEEFNFVTALVINKSYIAIEGNDIVVYLQDGNKAILFNYNAITTDVTYGFTQIVPDYAVKAFFDDEGINGSYENDMTEMMKVTLSFLK